MLEARVGKGDEMAGGGETIECSFASFQILISDLCTGSGVNGNGRRGAFEPNSLARGAERIVKPRLILLR